MRFILLFSLVVLLFTACKKKKEVNNNAPNVEIYLLKTFVLDINQSTNPGTVFIANAVLENQPLVADTDIEMYTRATTSFRLSKNIKTLIKDFGPDKAFAVTVDRQPVYYGKFHPAWLSSIALGIATIDPLIYTTEHEISIQYATITGNTNLQQLDKRNDPVLINALEASGRLR